MGTSASKPDPPTASPGPGQGPVLPPAAAAIAQSQSAARVRRICLLHAHPLLFQIVAIGNADRLHLAGIAGATAGNPASGGLQASAGPREI